MVFSLRGKKCSKKGPKNELLEGNINLELTIPTHFRCPISLDLMKDPVTLATGITYDRESIEKWIDSGNLTCPVTHQMLHDLNMVPNHSLRKMIQDWCVENKSHGIERIPTPRIPISAYQVSQICLKIVDATEQSDEEKLKGLIRKVKVIARESEKNKNCIVENGAGRVFAGAFDSFASLSMEKYADLLKRILSVLAWMFPFGEQGLSKIGSRTSLQCMVWFLKGEDLSGKQNSVIVLKQLLSLDKSYANKLMEIEGVAETLIKIVHAPISPAAMKASLVVMYNLMEGNEKVMESFVDMGLAQIVIEVVVDGEKSMSEKALGILDQICNYPKGKEIASSYALTMPVLVKKLLRVTELATEFTVSIMWKLCSKNHENLVVEALQVGAFPKLLVLLQVGCVQSTKEKVTDLLKLMNLYKDKVECVDSASGFKYLKGSN
ncbi:hypothetical protein LIER_26546 [Lithospermum erythrorhizon]|uniref:U-box domain-containing protein n=1 Tax=Lithospermum erythrorhizon TaxID=34254 RepID=A0AAV3RA94_LITER